MEYMCGKIQMLATKDNGKMEKDMDKVFGHKIMLPTMELGDWDDLKEKEFKSMRLEIDTKVNF